MGVRGGASMRMGAAPPSSAPKSLLAVSGESESEVQLPRFDSPCRQWVFRREPADSLGVWLQAMGIVYLEMVCVRN
jgi:hypothetical protein